MQDRDAIAEARREARERLRGHRDLGHEHDHAAAALERLLGGGEVDLGLARSGDAVEQQLLALGIQGADDPLRRGPLRGVELDRARNRADRGRNGPAAHLAVGELDEPAALEAQQRVASDACLRERPGADLGVRRR